MSKISVEVDGNGVSSGVRSISKDLSKLRDDVNKTFKSFDQFNSGLNSVRSTNLNKLSKGLTDFAVAIELFKNSNSQLAGKQLSYLNTNLKSISDLNLSTTSRNIQKLSNSLAKMSSVNFSGSFTEIEKFKSNLEGLNSLNITGVVRNTTTFQKSLNNLGKVPYKKISSGILSIDKAFKAINSTSFSKVIKDMDQFNRNLRDMKKNDISSTVRNLGKNIDTLSISMNKQAAILAKVADRVEILDNKSKKAAITTSSLNRSVNTSVIGFGTLQTALISVSAALGLTELKEYADTWKQVTNLVRLGTQTEEQLISVRQRLVQLSLETRTDLKAQTTLYNRLTIVQKELGVSQRQIVGVLGTVGKALAVTSTSTLEARGSLIQLSQALGQGIVRAEEFNSIMEGTPRIAKAVADGLGITRAELRKLVLAGQITSRDFFIALQSQAEDLEKEFSKVDKTIGQAFTNLRTTLITTVGAFDDITGASGEFVKLIDKLSTSLRDVNLEAFSNTLIETGEIVLKLATVIGVGRVTAGLVGGISVLITSLGAATTAARAFNVAINSNWVALTALAAILSAKEIKDAFDRVFGKAADDIERLNKISLTTLKERIIDVKEAIEVGDLDIIEDMLGESPIKIKSAIYNITGQIDTLQSKIEGFKAGSVIVGKAAFSRLRDTEKEIKSLQDVLDGYKGIESAVENLRNEQGRADAVENRRLQGLTKQKIQIIASFTKEREALEKNISAAERAKDIYAKLKPPSARSTDEYRQAYTDLESIMQKGVAAQAKLDSATAKYEKTLKSLNTEAGFDVELGFKQLTQDEQRLKNIQRNIVAFRSESSEYEKELKAQIVLGEKSANLKEKLDKLERSTGQTSITLRKEINKNIEDGLKAREELNRQEGKAVAGTADGYNDLNRRSKKYIDQIKEESRLRKKAQKDYDRILKKQEREWEKFYDKSVDFAGDSLSSLFKNSEDGWDAMLDSWYDSFLDTISKMIANEIIVPVVFNMVGGTGGPLGTISQMLGYQTGGGAPAGKAGGSGLPVNAGSLQWLSQNMPGFAGLQGLLATSLPGTGGITLNTMSTASQLGVPQAGVISNIGGVSLGQALGFGGFGSLGYSMLGGKLGLPQNEYTGITSGLGGALGGTYAGGALSAAGLGALGGPVGIALGAIAGGLLGGMLGDEKKPDVRISTVLGQGEFGVGFKDVSGSENRDQITDAVTDYFRNTFTELGKVVNFSVEDALKNSSIYGRIRLDKLDEDDPNSLFTKLIESAFTGGQKSTEFSGSLRETFLDAMGLSAETFSIDFFKNIQVDSEDLISTFTRFASVAEEFDDFNSRFAMQIEEGFSSTKAFENLLAIVAVTGEYTSAVETISESTITQNLKQITEQWNKFIEVLVDSGATIQEITAIEENRNTVVGSQLTGITADSLTQALVGGNFQTVFTENLKKQAGLVVASNLSEQLFNSVFQPILEDIGGKSSSLYSGSQEDISSAWNDIIKKITTAVNNVDLSQFNESLRELGILTEDNGERIKLQIQLLKLEGKEDEALKLQRQELLKVTSDSLKPIQERIWLLEDEQKALENYKKFIDPINEELSTMDLSPTEKSIYNINRAYEENVKKAKELGLANRDLNKIEELRISSIRKVADEIKKSIDDQLSTIDMSETEQELYGIKKQYEETINQVKAIEEMTSKTSSGLDAQTKATLSTTNAVNFMNENVSNILKSLFDLIRQSGTKPGVVGDVQSIALKDVDFSKLSGQAASIVRSIFNLSADVFGKEIETSSLKGIRQKLSGVQSAPSEEQLKETYGFNFSLLSELANSFAAKLKTAGVDSDIEQIKASSPSTEWALSNLGLKSIEDIENFISTINSVKNKPTIDALTDLLIKAEKLEYSKDPEVIFPSLDTGGLAESAYELQQASFKKSFTDFFSGIQTEFDQLNMTDLEKQVYQLQKIEEGRISSLNTYLSYGVITQEEYEDALQKIHALTQSISEETRQVGIENIVSGFVSFNKALDETYQVSGELILFFEKLNSNELPVLTNSFDALNAAIASTEDSSGDFVTSLVSFGATFEKLNDLFAEGSITKEQYNSLLSQSTVLYTKSIDQIKKNKTNWESFVDSIDSWLSKLNKDATNPEELYRKTNEVFQDTLQRALEGDVKAQGKLSGAADDFLNASLAFNTNQMTYASDFARVRVAMEEAQQYGKEQVSSIDQMLEVAKEQVIDLKNISNQSLESLNSLYSVDETVKAINESIVTEDIFDLLLNRYLGGDSSLLNLLKGLSLGKDLSVSRLTDQNIVSGVTREVGVSLDTDVYATVSAKVQQMIDAGVASGLSVAITLAAASKELREKVPNISNLADIVKKVKGDLDIPGFVSGGYHPGGIRMVGEGGPEVEVTAPSYIHNTSDTAKLLGRQYMEEMAKELKQLREDFRIAMTENIKANKDTAFYTEREYIEKQQPTTI